MAEENKRRRDRADSLAWNGKHEFQNTSCKFKGKKFFIEKDEEVRSVLIF